MSESKPRSMLGDDAEPRSVAGPRSMLGNKHRVRSPSYPAFGLEEAIRKADVIYEDIDRHAVSVEVLAKQWGFSETSSGFLVAVAALKQFGLLVDEGRGDARKVRLSEPALSILIHEDGSPERKEALKQAALAPKIHQELWERFQGRLPTTDAAIRVYLLKGRKDEGIGEVFNKATVDAFIQQFRSTIAFAELHSSDILVAAVPAQPSDTNRSEERKVAVEKTTPNAPVASKPPRSDMGEGGPFIFFPLPGGNAVEIRLRSKLSADDFETVKKLIDLSKASLVRSDEN